MCHNLGSIWSKVWTVGAAEVWLIVIRPTTSFRDHLAIRCFRWLPSIAAFARCYVPAWSWSWSWWCWRTQENVRGCLCLNFLFWIWSTSWWSSTLMHVWRSNSRRKTWSRSIIILLDIRSIQHVRSGTSIIILISTCIRCSWSRFRLISHLYLIGPMRLNIFIIFSV